MRKTTEFFCFCIWSLCFSFALTCSHRFGRLDFSLISQTICQVEQPFNVFWIECVIVMVWVFACALWLFNEFSYQLSRPPWFSSQILQSSQNVNKIFENSRKLEFASRSIDSRPSNHCPAGESEAEKSFYIANMVAREHFVEFESYIDNNPFSAADVARKSAGESFKESPFYSQPLS